MGVDVFELPTMAYLSKRCEAETPNAAIAVRRQTRG